MINCIASYYKLTDQNRACSGPHWVKATFTKAAGAREAVISARVYHCQLVKSHRARQQMGGTSVYCLEACLTMADGRGAAPETAEGQTLVEVNNCTDLFNVSIPVNWSSIALSQRDNGCVPRCRPVASSRASRSTQNVCKPKGSRCMAALIHTSEVAESVRDGNG